MTDHTFIRPLNNTTTPLGHRCPSARTRTNSTRKPASPSLISGTNTFYFSWLSRLHPLSPRPATPLPRPALRAWHLYGRVGPAGLWVAYKDAAAGCGCGCGGGYMHASVLLAVFNSEMEGQQEVRQKQQQEQEQDQLHSPPPAGMALALPLRPVTAATRPVPVHAAQQVRPCCSRRRRRCTMPLRGRNYNAHNANAGTSSAPLATR
ncbi:hypothetical protein B0J12DRAFT_701268 [Macrophomina phaseolina]|uniref:Uncharacterized protein n=1 Tax=Macrophomina phaseolina TaxID=35725 RepID=A0ABQ8G7Z0_9PEZI|nr:hypothetical protein B0J12DRAFT_701268 [Macrophomina phaseolina]